MTSSPDPPAGDGGDPHDGDPHSGDPHGGAADWSPTPARPVLEPRVSRQILSIAGIVCAVVAVLFLPVLFGLAGVVLGIVGHTRGEPLGRWAAIAAGAGMLVGTLLSILLASG
ncbi:hypothetical protein GCM10022224_089950 [Nonomuraea antimicrobica]|uniref:DUF4190 domain-containing protein n=1 Tax=Nonomuraea antimicrobica TaxID=561173 RepID=A0ABP7DWE7_9ACTN